MQTHQRVGTYAFIQNPLGEILIVQRAANDSHPGMWELPGGGIDPDESPIEAVIREAKEETGIRVTPILPFSVIMHDSSTAKQVFRIVYLCTVDETQTSVTLSSEHSGYRWVTLATLLKEQPSDFLLQIANDYRVFKKYGTQETHNR